MPKLAPMPPTRQRLVSYEDERLSDEAQGTAAAQPVRTQTSLLTPVVAGERPRSKSLLSAAGGGHKRAGSGNFMSRLSLFRAGLSGDAASNSDGTASKDATVPRADSDSAKTAEQTTKSSPGKGSNRKKDSLDADDEKEDGEDENNEPSPVSVSQGAAAAASAMASALGEQGKKGRKRKGSLRKTALLGTGLLRRSSNASATPGADTKTSSAKVGASASTNRFSRLSRVEYPSIESRTAASAAVAATTAAASAKLGDDGQRSPVPIVSTSAPTFTNTGLVASPLASPTGTFGSTTTTDEDEIMEFGSNRSGQTGLNKQVNSQSNSSSSSSSSSQNSYALPGRLQLQIPHTSMPAPGLDPAQLYGPGAAGGLRKASFPASPASSISDASSLYRGLGTAMATSIIKSPLGSDGPSDSARTSLDSSVAGSVQGLVAAGTLHVRKAGSPLLSVAVSASTENAEATGEDESAVIVGEWDYSETAWWGWVVLAVTWIVFVVGMGSCLEVWSWAWDVGHTPYAPPELEDDPTLPIVGYYPALMVLTGVMSWVWVVVAWVGMKYFKHAKIQSEEADT